MGELRPDTVVLNWLLLLPFFAALCAALFPRLSLPLHSEREAETLRRGPFLLGAMASFMGAALSVSLLPWIMGRTPITADYWWTRDLYHLRFQADALSVPLVGLIHGLGLLLHLQLVGLPLTADTHRRGGLLLAAQGSAAAACLAADLVLLVFLIQLALLSLWLLSRSDDPGAANRLLAAAYVGGLVLLGGAVALWAMVGDASLAPLGMLTVAVEPERLQTAALLVLLGALPLLAAFPAHGWVPDLAGAARAGAAAPALLLPVVGAAALLRLLPGSMMLATMPALGAVALMLGVASLWWGALRAWTAAGLSDLAAWLTVAQSGHLLIAIGAAASPTASADLVRAAAVHALVAPAGLVAVWLAAGAARARFATDSIAHLTGLLPRAPLLVAVALAGGLSLAGLPLLPGFQVQRLLVSALLQGDGAWFAVVVVGGDLLIALAVLDAARRLARRPERPLPSVPGSAWLSAGLVAALLAILAVGAFPGSLTGWSEAVLRGVLSVSRGGLSFTP